MRYKVEVRNTQGEWRGYFPGDVSLAHAADKREAYRLWARLGKVYRLEYVGFWARVYGGEGFDEMRMVDEKGREPKYDATQRDRLERDGG